jgi:hypothetical protein
MEQPGRLPSFVCSSLITIHDDRVVRFWVSYPTPLTTLTNAPRGTWSPAQQPVA